MKGWGKPLGKLGEDPPSSWNSRYKSPEMQCCEVCSRKTRRQVLLEWVAERPVEGDEVRNEVGGPSAMIQALNLILSLMGSCRRTENSAVWLL